MASIKIDPKTYPIRMEGEYPDEGLFLIGATVEEGLSELGRITVEFVCSNRALNLKDIVGKKMRVLMEPPTGERRVFPGTCVSVEYLGADRGPGHFCAEIRPWLWFLTRTRENRIFQDKSVPDVIRAILQDYGFSSDIEDKLTGSYVARDYLVQYRETDYDFLCRLMEEEGIYFFFAEKDNREKLVLVDDAGAHAPVAAPVKIPFIDIAAVKTRQEPHIFEWTSAERVTSGKVTLMDYDFERPTADMVSVNAIPKGTHAQKDREFYDYPGHYRDSGLGGNRARVRMEAEAARHRTLSGKANITNIAVGQTFTLDGHPRKPDNASHLVTSAVHRLVLVGTDLPPVRADGPLHGDLAGLADSGDPYSVAFRCIPATAQFRAPLKTPWPEIAGVHTALVVGPKGDEIYTDKYGRIKVQFHWDRLGKKDDKSSCFVRTMMPWTGKNWGVIAVPRIGQEVVIQFEEGDPDRPIAIGMLYNADNMPPYGLPDNMTQSGIKTNSSKGGGGFNELMFEDKKDAELVRFQAEKDYEQIVKNDATITVGLEKKDKGDMSVTVHRNLTETVKTGDHTHTVEQGDQTLKVSQGKQTETIKGDVAWTVEQGNVTRKVSQGSVKEDIDMGDLEVVLGMGSETKTINMGDFMTEVIQGKIKLSAMQSIELKCMASSIKMDAMGITIKGINVKIKADVILEAKATMTTVKGDAMLVLKGGITLIN